MSDLVAEAITEAFGERCPDFEPECHCCKAWAEFDRITTLEAELQKAREALSELERYVSMECYDQWLPEGHAKTSRLSRLIDRTQAAIRALSQDKEARDEAL